MSKTQLANFENGRIQSFADTTLNIDVKYWQPLRRTNRGSDAEHAHGCSRRSREVRKVRKYERTVCVDGRTTHPHEDGYAGHRATPAPVDLQ